MFPTVDADDLRGALGGPLPDEPTDPREVIAALRDGAEPGVVAIPSGRYFGFVIGGSVPAALAADWLTSTWDQNAGLYAGRSFGSGGRGDRGRAGSASCSASRRTRRSRS